MIEIQLFGSPAIKRDGAATPPPKGRKAWGLLVYLLLSEVRNPSREHLAGLLFADTDDPLRSLRWNLSELRRALGQEILEPGEAVIRLPPDARVDVYVLLRGTPHEALAIPGLARPLLEGMEFGASPAFDSWIGHERRRLEGASCSALHESVLDRLAAGRSEEAVGLARRLVELEPFDENFHEVLIRALAQAGDNDGARRQLEACRSVFRAELGREPAESLERATTEQPSSNDSHSMGRSVQHAAGALIEAGEAAVAAGAADAGLQNLRRALSLAHEASQGELEVRARVALGSALVHAVRGRDEEAASVLGRAATLAAELELFDLESAAIRELSYIDALAGRYARCETRLEQAASLAQAERELAAVESLRAVTAGDRGAHATALERFERADELATSAGDLKRVAYTCTFAGRSLLLTGEREAARAKFEQAIGIVGETEWLSYAAWPHSWLAELELEEGDLAGARERMEYAFALACEFRDPCWEGIAGRGLGVIEEREGKTASALRRLEDARTRASRTTDCYVWVEAYALEAFAATAVRAGSGRAESLVEDLHSLTARTGMRELAVRALILRSRLGDSGAMDAARLLAAEVENPALDAEIGAGTQATLT
ncbi:MAG: SARP family transcriptional regulator [Actinomycetota bacterium]|nr:SARP family transcriptional regulator [Actinomycetota bacterium]